MSAPVNLGHFPKASAGHVLAFRPCTRVQLALVAVFTFISVTILVADALCEQDRQYQILARV